MERPRKAGHRNTMLRKMLVVISALVFCSVLLAAISSHIRFIYDYTNRAADDMQQLAEQVSMNIEAYLDELFRLCLSPYYSNRVMEQLELEPEDQIGRLEKRRIIEDYLRQVMTIPRKDVMRVFILSDSVYLSTRGSYGELDSDFRREGWYQEALADNSYVFIPSGGAGGSPVAFSVAKQINSLGDNKKILGVIRVDANHNGIKAVCDRVDVLEDGAVLVTDSAGRLIYGNSRLPEGLAVSDLVGASLENGAKAKKFDGKAYILNSATIPGTMLRILVVNSCSVLTGNAQRTLVFNCFLALCLAALAIMVSSMAIRSQLKPLYDTVGVMRKVQSGDLAVRADPDCTDEISYLNTAFNSMLDRFQQMIVEERELTRQVYEAKYRQKQAQFDALHHQMHPHFLFNTLNTISLLVKCGRRKEAVHGIDRLSLMLRGMVDANREISLESELAITESYLQLQSLRYEGLSFDIDRGNVDLSCLIPALAIQPIVENALEHGFSDKRDGMRIEVRLRYDAEALNIRIEDNGGGMKAEDLAALKQRLAASGAPADDRQGGHGIGLANIQRRIQLEYGEGYGLDVASEEGRGTVVTLRLPVGDQKCTRR